MPSNPDVAGGASLTKHLVDTLRAFGFKATFNIVGDTSENYPDRPGREGKFYWGGVAYDHYPDFGADGKGGANNCFELVRMISDAGCELANHGYRHLLFGYSPVYMRRSPLKGFDEVVGDLKRLHELVLQSCGIEMRLSRPPHYIDGIAGGFSSYDAYVLMGYNYLAASFDGGGWMPQRGSYEDEVERMVSALERELDRDPDSLNGQIIFQKDGCNLSRKTPIASVLGPQLELLKKYGYRVVTVSELTDISPFEDLPPENPCFEAAKSLVRNGYAAGFADNTFRPDAPLNFGELCAVLCPRDEFIKSITLRLRGQSRIDGIPLKHRYSAALSWAYGNGIKLEPAAAVDSEMLFRMLRLMRRDAEVREDRIHTHASAAIEISRNLIS
jgi:peptidoglycan/xylan/chitin deacetylase (PgdA/CDA1 family)